MFKPGDLVKFNEHYVSLYPKGVDWSTDIEMWDDAGPHQLFYPTDIFEIINIRDRETCVWCPRLSVFISGIGATYVFELFNKET